MTYNAPNHLVTIPPEIFPIDIYSDYIREERRRTKPKTVILNPINKIQYNPLICTRGAYALRPNVQLKLFTLYGFITIYFSELTKIINQIGLHHFFDNSQTNVTMFIPNTLTHAQLSAANINTGERAAPSAARHDNTLQDNANQFRPKVACSGVGKTRGFPHTTLKNTREDIQTYFDLSEDPKTLIQTITVPNILTSAVLSSSKNMLIYSIKSPNCLLVSEINGLIYIMFNRDENKKYKIIQSDIFCSNGVVHIVEQIFQ